MRVDKLHSILRTNKSNVNYIVVKIPDEYIRYMDNKKYIRGYIVLTLIARSIEENGVGNKNIYLQASRKYYDSILASDKATLVRLEYDSLIKNQLKKLRDKRKRKYKIKNDELTKETLKRGSEFSHIRSVSLYKHLSDQVENGLVVNKSTHSIITENGVNDENQLRDLCIEMGWSTEWYEIYINAIKFIVM